MRAIVVVFVFSALTGGSAPASADRWVAAAAQGDGIAFAYRVHEPENRWGWAVYHAPDGQNFVQIPTGTRWVLALHVLDDGTLILADVADRAEPVTVHRILGEQRTAHTVAGSNGGSDLQLLSFGQRLMFLDATGARMSRDGGRSFRNPVGYSSSGYGFYAASASVGPRGVELLVPDFNTCGSSDRLEFVDHHRVTWGGQVRTWPVPDTKIGMAMAIGRRGVTYRVDLTDAAQCVLRSSESGAALASVSGPCNVRTASSARHTVGLVGDELFRLRGVNAVRLGTVSAADDPAVGPDSRGRALVFDADRTLRRFSSQHTPEVLWSLP
ncbi:MAG: hypothetical protein AAGF12_11760 [Myxococcota bacterium]